MTAEQHDSSLPTRRGRRGRARTTSPRRQSARGRTPSSARRHSRVRREGRRGSRRPAVRAPLRAVRRRRRRECCCRSARQSSRDAERPVGTASLSPPSASPNRKPLSACQSSAWLRNGGGSTSTVSPGVEALEIELLREERRPGWVLVPGAVSRRAGRSRARRPTVSTIRSARDASPATPPRARRSGRRRARRRARTAPGSRCRRACASRTSRHGSGKSVVAADSQLRSERREHGEGERERRGTDSPAAAAARSRTAG